MAMIAKDSGNAQRSVLCDTDGRLLVGGITLTSVTVSIVPTTSIVSNNSIAAIAGNAQTTLLDYTNTTGGLVLMDGFVTDGTVDAEYEMQIGGVKKMIMRSAEMERNVTFFLPTPLRIENNGSITLKVTHYKSFTADFDASLFAHRP